MLAQRSAFQQRGTSAGQLAVFDAFLEHVVPAARDAGIGRVPLLRLLSRPAAPQTPPPAGSMRTTSAPVPAVGANIATGPVSTGPSPGPPKPRKRPALRMSSAPAALPGPTSSAAELSAGSDLARDRGTVSGRPPAAVPPAATQGTPARSASFDVLREACDEAAVAARPMLSAGAAAPKHDSRKAAAADPQPASLAVTDAHITLLLNAGLLARHPQEAHAYLFSVPTTGPLVRSIAKGRAEVNIRPGDHETLGPGPQPSAAHGRAVYKAAQTCRECPVLLSCYVLR